MIQLTDYPFTKQECVMTDKKHVDRERRPNCDDLEGPDISTQGFTGNDPDSGPTSPPPPPPTGK